MTVVVKEEKFGRVKRELKKEESAVDRYREWGIQRVGDTEKVKI